MIEDKIARAIWAINEIVEAGDYGITRQELSRKWMNSSMNCAKDKGIPERTFYRLRDMLQSVFGVDIECVKVTPPRYRLSAADRGPDRPSLFNLILNKVTSKEESKPSSLRDIVALIMAGSNVSPDDAAAIRAAAQKIRRIPYDYGLALIDAVKEGEIPGAQDAEWDWDYSRYLNIWNDTDLNRTGTWLAVGISEECIRFYFVTNIQDPVYLKNLGTQLESDNGMQYKRGYWWYEPSDKSLFQLNFQTFPDMNEVKRRVEILIAKIASITEKIHKPEK